VFVTDDVVVGFEDQLDEDEVLAFCDEYGAEPVRPIEGLENTYVLRMYDGHGDAAVRTAAAMRTGRPVSGSGASIITVRSYRPRVR